MDVRCLFSEEDLNAMDEKRRCRAVEASYQLTEEIIAALRPEIIIAVSVRLVAHKRRAKQNGHGSQQGMNWLTNYVQVYVMPDRVELFKWKLGAIRYGLCKDSIPVTYTMIPA
ncbi:hypothetical protein BGZ63DRAFT_438461 [Mariannaea sp. PMI_226]|nr:hypothetical protein BGZ63DRAFT_438461 [Mariannaea sp. PMI_226]